MTNFRCNSIPHSYPIGLAKTTLQGVGAPGLGACFWQPYGGASNRNNNGVKAVIGYGYYGEMMGDLAWVWLLIVFAVVIALVIWGRRRRLRSRDRATEPMPLEILRRRYAAGEITTQEFEQAKQAIA